MHICYDFWYTPAVMQLARKKDYQNTTVRLPRRVYELAKAAVKNSAAVSSFNDFVIQAIEQKIQQLSETQIDAAFSQMANDPDYRRDSLLMAEEFEKSDWEAWRGTELSNASVPKARAPKARPR